MMDFARRQDKETGGGEKIESEKQKRQRDNEKNNSPFFYTAAIS